jgi:hypothetical protein
MGGCGIGSFGGGSWCAFLILWVGKVWDILGGLRPHECRKEMQWSCNGSIEYHVVIKVILNYDVILIVISLGCWSQRTVCN